MWSKTSDHKIINSQWCICQQFVFQGFLWYTLPETSILIFKVNLLLQGLKLTILKIRDNGFLQSSMFSVVLPFLIRLIFHIGRKIPWDLPWNLMCERNSKMRARFIVLLIKVSIDLLEAVFYLTASILLYSTTPKWFPLNIPGCACGFQVGKLLTWLHT